MRVNSASVAGLLAAAARVQRRSARARVPGRAQLRNVTAARARGAAAAADATTRGLVASNAPSTRIAGLFAWARTARGVCCVLLVGGPRRRHSHKLPGFVGGGSQRATVHGWFEASEPPGA